MDMKELTLPLFLLIFCAGLAWAQGDNRVDALVQPKHQPAVVTVGGAGADIAGYTSRAIQLAIDAVKTRGGGTVHLNAGTYQLSGPVRLSSGITLEGSGPETILKKSAGFRTHFVIDADWGMLKVQAEDPSGFHVGDGLELFDNTYSQGWDVTTAVITAIDGHTLYLDNATVHDYIASDGGTISNAFSPIEAVGAENVRIANLVVDGSAESNDYLNGCRGGGIYLHKARNCVVEGVEVRNFNGDSFSWQVDENITIRNCEASHGRGLGFHPGTGSDHSVVENNVSHDNELDGFFLCWRVQHGVFRNNQSYRNGRFGISIGHKDTDNLFVNNHVYENARHGVNFREETEENSGHRNTFRQNTIENNGTDGAEAYGFYIGGHTHDIVIEDNTIGSSGKGAQKAAVFIGPNSDRVTFESNRVSGQEGVIRAAASEKKENR